MLKVKVCGITDADNAKAIAETGIDFAGFIFYPGSKRYVGEMPDNRLFENIPESVVKVGVFVNENPSTVMGISRFAGIEMVQLHGNETVSYCGSLRSCGLKVIKAFRIGSKTDLQLINAYSDVCDYFLFDSSTGSYGGSGTKFNWQIIEGAGFSKPFFLSGGIGPEDAHLLKKITCNMFFAADINSRFEVKPGIKDTDKVKKFTDQIRNLS